MKTYLAALGLATLFATSPAPAQYQLAHNAAPGNPKSEASLRFARLVAERTDGRVRIDVGGSGQFADDAEALTNMRLGALAFSANSQGPVATVVPEIGLVGLPFLFTSLEEAYAVLDGPVGDRLAEAADSRGLVLLSIWNNGIRQVTNNVRPIRTPDDLRNLRVRVPPDPMTVDIFDTLGAIPVPLAFSELYIALQQGVVDGQENPLINTYSSRLHEVQRFVSFTNHKYEMTPLVASKLVFERFSPEDQAAIREAAAEAGRFNREQSEADEIALRTTLAEAGIAINDVDPDAFVAMTQPVYDEWRALYPDLVAQIVAATEAARP